MKKLTRIVRGGVTAVLLATTALFFSCSDLVDETKDMLGIEDEAEKMMHGEEGYYGPKWITKTENGSFTNTDGIAFYSFNVDSSTSYEIKVTGSATFGYQLTQTEVDSKTLSYYVTSGTYTLSPTLSGYCYIQVIPTSTGDFSLTVKSFTTSLVLKKLSLNSGSSNGGSEPGIPIDDPNITLYEVWYNDSMLYAFEEYELENLKDLFEAGDYTISGNKITLTDTGYQKYQQMLGPTVTLNIVLEGQVIATIPVPIRELSNDTLYADITLTTIVTDPVADGTYYVPANNQ
ncbi:MAG: hypothetical protein K6G80_00850 [Treponema sp.]|nr:hypothetical protein [Treponema sp.]